MASPSVGNELVRSIWHRPHEVVLESIQEPLLAFCLEAHLSVASDGQLDQWRGIVVEDLTRDDEFEESSLPIGAIVGTAVTAGIIAYLIRRARAESTPKTPADVALNAWDRARTSDFRDRAGSITREFMVDRVLPEMKPILLDLVRDVKALVDQGFKRAEKSIRDL